MKGFSTTEFWNSIWPGGPAFPPEVLLSDSHSTENDLPQPVDHEQLLLLAHPDTEQAADLAQRSQQVDGVTHRGLADGVGLPQGLQQLPDAVVLSLKEAEHHSDQLRILDLVLLGPADHGL